MVTWWKSARLCYTLTVVLRVAYIHVCIVIILCMFILHVHTCTWSCLHETAVNEDQLDKDAVSLKKSKIFHSQNPSFFLHYMYTISMSHLHFASSCLHSLLLSLIFYHVSWYVCNDCVCVCSPAVYYPLQYLHRRTGRSLNWKICLRRRGPGGLILVQNCESQHWFLWIPIVGKYWWELIWTIAKKKKFNRLT